MFLHGHHGILTQPSLRYSLKLPIWSTPCSQNFHHQQIASWYTISKYSWWIKVAAPQTTNHPLKKSRKSRTAMLSSWYSKPPSPFFEGPEVKIWPVELADCERAGTGRFHEVIWTPTSTRVQPRKQHKPVINPPSPAPLVNFWKFRYSL